MPDYQDWLDAAPYRRPLWRSLLGSLTAAALSAAGGLIGHWLNVTLVATLFTLAGGIAVLTGVALVLFAIADTLFGPWPRT